LALCTAEDFEKVDLEYIWSVLELKGYENSALCLKMDGAELKVRNKADDRVYEGVRVSFSDLSTDPED